MTTQSLSTLGLAALTYAVEYGWAVFPVHSVEAGRCTCGDPACETPGKHPRTRNGLSDASSHPEQIAAWWDRWPTANIGLQTGRGLVVIDVDGHEGVVTLAAYPPLPSTVVAVTGREGGGRHHYFRVPAGDTINNTNGDRGSRALGVGLDTRGDGGYVILPPSVHVSGRRYAWEAGRSPDAMEIAILPDFLFARLRALVPATAQAPRPGDAADLRALMSRHRALGHTPADIAQRLDRDIRRRFAAVGHQGKGARDDAAFYLAAYLVNDMAASDDVAWAYLSEWDSGNNPPLGERELRKKMRSGKKNAKRPRGCALKRGSVA